MNRKLSESTAGKKRVVKSGVAEVKINCDIPSNSTASCTFMAAASSALLASHGLNPMFATCLTFSSTSPRKSSVYPEFSWILRFSRIESWWGWVFRVQLPSSSRSWQWAEAAVAAEEAAVAVANTCLYCSARGF